eukprot:TRINITY_DN108182_c0_g1_i1.p1 TRINITY_DN108182_c0_g1~~TRINITY_DN108182_c0_g1_i1.p1  ORF type:complete len:404 (+),score=76.76 TRINITY_DN108182_c0_g1_i1:27-1238(+)
MKCHVLVCLWQAAAIVAVPSCDTDTCAADVKTALRWRGFPYKVSNPKFARSIYGGSFVASTFSSQGFEGPEESDHWDVLWTHRDQEAALTGLQLPERLGTRLVNHCRYFKAAGNKCELARYISHLVSANDGVRQRQLLSFALDGTESASAWRRRVSEDPNKYWILKPCLAGASRGILVHRGEHALEAARSLGDSVTVQEYLLHPYLGFGDSKFHMRLYVFVPRWAPIAAYLYNDGLIFRSRDAYRQDLAPEVARDVFSEVSQKVEALPLSNFWRALDAKEKPRSAAVKERIVETLSDLFSPQALRDHMGPPDLHGSRSYACFDLFGADVILNSDLQPFVMEFNIGPNLWVDNHGEDWVGTLQSVKGPLITQLVHWASLRVRAETHQAVELAEQQALLNFTRLG